MGVRWTVRTWRTEFGLEVIVEDQILPYALGFVMVALMFWLVWRWEVVKSCSKRYTRRAMDDALGVCELPGTVCQKSTSEEVVLRGNLAT